MKTDLNKIVNPLLLWYDRNARILPWREDNAAYRVWISEIMLQQTRVEAVKPYFERFMKEVPDIKSLANIQEEKLLKLWEGLGYYNRARNLQKTAQIVMSNFNGLLPSNIDDLLSLPGIGEYTAGAVGSIAFGLPVPCIDGNVLRVITRITENSGDITNAKVKKAITNEVAEILPKDRAGDFNQSLMELGATICLPNGMPKCKDCPLSSQCNGYQNQTMLNFPVKPKKRSRRIEKKTVFLFISENKVALQKRDAVGLLAGLWEFPNEDSHLSEKSVKEILCEKGFSVEKIEKVKNAKHIFTHIEWQMCGYLIFCNPSEKDSTYTWVSKNQLMEEIAVPSAFNSYYIEAVHVLT